MFILTHLHVDKTGSTYVAQIHLRVQLYTVNRHLLKRLISPTKQLTYRIAIKMVI